MQDMSSRTQAAEAYIKALRTGEPSATQAAGQYLADDVVLATANDEIKGHDNVLKRITGQWPLTPVFQHAGFSTQESDGVVKAEGEVPPMGAAPQKISLTFSFDGDSKIKRIEQQQQAAGAQTFETIPGFVRGIINGALNNGTPMVVAYTDENGQPALSLRGSTQVYGDTQLCIWVRNADGGIVRAMSSANNRVSMLYRDSRARTTLVIQGRGHVETDPAVRERVYQLSPEVEQNHDTGRKGAALIIDVTSLGGTTVRGPVRVTPEG
jgi:hypothetical protein